MKIDVRCPADPIWSLNNDGPFIRWMCMFNYTMLNRPLLVCPILDAMRGLGSPNTSRENRVGSLSTREPGEAPLPHSNILWFQNAQFNNPRNRMMINLTVSNNVPIWRNLCAKNLNDFRRFCWVAQPTVMVDQLRLLFPDMDGSSFASFASAGDEAETAPAVCFPRTEENVGYTYGGFQKHGSTDLHNRVFLTSTCQNASRFVIFQISNFVKRRRKVCRGFFSSRICSLCLTWTCCGDRSIDRFYPRI